MTDDTNTEKQSIPLWKNPDLYCHDLPTEPCPDVGTVLVTGASGYIGGRLVPELTARGYRVRVMVRAALPESQELWPNIEVVVADALDKESLRKALSGIDTAYYLIHSLLLGPEKLEVAEIQASTNFRKVAEQEHVKRIIYLGGLGDIHYELSPHLRSRMKVSEELQHGSVPVTILRAAIIIGSGSASYEIIRHLVKRIPVFIIPRWAENLCQPIAIRDVIKYLVGVLETPATAGKSYDICGPDILTYKMMLKVCAEVYQLKRIFIPFPTWNIGIFSYFTSLLTPVPAQLTRYLMGGLTNDIVCQTTSIIVSIPFQCLSYREAITRAKNIEEQDTIFTRWTSAYPPAYELAVKLDELRERADYTTRYSLTTEKEAPALFQSICTVGGKEGWFSNNWMWRLRGLIDKIFMGVGDLRGRRSRNRLNINDVIGFWRIEDLRPNKRLLLRAEMKMPGKAWLEFTIEDDGDKRKLSVIPYYYTKTLAGKLYWYVFLPFHGYIFNDLIKDIEKKS
ncbi:MAG: SDR family oxidoreductase [Candidatus Latescibacter sp.]|nr:SDR family oxidoreductase [Candidatus Latescibacter sp.]